jgi:hypothetical protein
MKALTIEVTDRSGGGDHPRADYWIQVYENDTAVLGGEIFCHVRAAGWRELLKLACQELIDSVEKGWGKKE